MTVHNTLIFVDVPSDDPAAAAEFYREVFGWVVEPLPGRRVLPRRARWPLPARGRLGLADRQPAPRPVQLGQRPPASGPGRRRAAHPEPRGPHGPDMDPGRRQRQRRTGSSTPAVQAGRRPSCGATTSGTSSTATTAPSRTRGATRGCCGARAATTRTSRATPRSDPPAPA